MTEQIIPATFAAAPKSDATITPEPDFANTPGNELLIPLEKVTASQVSRLMGAAGGLANMRGDTFGAYEGELIANLIDLVQNKFTVDKEAFHKFASGPGSFKRTLALVMAYVNELGKDEN